MDEQLALPPARAPIRHDGSEGDTQKQVSAARTVFACTSAVLATLGGAMALVVIVEKRADGTVAHEPNAPPVAAVTPVRPAPWDELLSSKAHAPGPPVPGLDKDADLVDKHGPPEVAGVN